MDYGLRAHPHFTEFRDPVSGVVSHLLDEVVAPVQQSFYFVNPSLSPDERWLWMQVAWPPAPEKTLAVVSMDPARPLVRHFPQAAFPTASPLVAPDGGVWFGNGPDIRKLDLDGRVETVFTLPADFLDGREFRRLATHLTLSADGEYFLLDGEVGDTWFVGTAHAGSGEFRLIGEFENRHNHAQACPDDPGVFIIARDKYNHPVSGEVIHHSERTFLMRTDGSGYNCINAEHRCHPFHGACHEWWSKDGRICYIDYDAGAYEYDPRNGRATHVWREPVCHAHCSADRRYWCADESPYYWQERPCKVLFFDRAENRRVEIQSAMPVPIGDYWANRSTYHIDPHPQFSPRDTCIVYTATSSGRPTVAVTPLDQLRAFESSQVTACAG